MVFHTVHSKNSRFNHISVRVKIALKNRLAYVSLWILDINTPFFQIFWWNHVKSSQVAASSPWIPRTWLAMSFTFTIASDGAACRNTPVVVNKWWKNPWLNYVKAPRSPQLWLALSLHVRINLRNHRFQGYFAMPNRWPPRRKLSRI